MLFYHQLVGTEYYNFFLIYPYAHPKDSSKKSVRFLLGIPLRLTFGIFHKHTCYM